MVRQFYSTVQKKGNTFLDFFWGRCCVLCVSYNTLRISNVPYGIATWKTARYFRVHARGVLAKIIAELRQRHFVCKQFGHGFALAYEMYRFAIDHYFSGTRASVVVGAHAHPVCACGADGEQIPFLNG